MADVLERAKKALGMTADFQDGALTEYILEAKEYMLDAGVSEEVLEADSSVGTIVRGACDLWNGGNGNFSSYFKQRVIQLSLKGGKKNV